MTCSNQAGITNLDNLDNINANFDNLDVVIIDDFVIDIISHVSHTSKLATQVSRISAIGLDSLDDFARLANTSRANADIPLAITNLTTNGNGDDIKQVYAVVDDCRGLINDKLKSIAYSLNNCFDINKLDEITDDNATNEINYDGIL